MLQVHDREKILVTIQKNILKKLLIKNIFFLCNKYKNHFIVFLGPLINQVGPGDICNYYRCEIVYT